MNFIMQVNYYGHFLLTLLLLPLLKKSGTKLEASRIINMSSITRFIASFDIDNYNRTGYWSLLRIYSNSKLSLVLFSHELTKKLIGQHVIVNCADPGFVSTKIYESYINFVGKIVRVLINVICKNTWEGAQTPIHMAVDQEAGKVSGQIFSNCKMNSSSMWNDVDKLSGMLWKQSAKLVSIDEKDISKINS
ncbi:putative RDH13 [Danaus plexippus plexippus]|uniref:RDH13 n=1 Tax=Danaus plexippus plexippus TaxID=278856 RepID=A0A212ER81_DANPL|nr:putative RDH13 [Danaus plexippus plexippus]